MNRKLKYLGLIAIGAGIISLAMGAVFIQQGFAKESYLVKAMQEEQITMDGVDGIVDTMAKAQVAGDTVREHRHTIAPTYGDLLGSGRFDPTNPQQLTYAQAMNLENYLYLAVASFGVFTVVKATGLFMVITAIGLGAGGWGLLIKSS
jgi:hypothetical protein